MLGRQRNASLDGDSVGVPDAGEPSSMLRMNAVAADEAARERPPAPVAWRELALARWALVDTFESGGRRYLIARTTSEPDRDALALDTRDRIILAHRAAGESLKVIASEVGLSVSTVARRLRLAMGRLGLRHLADLAALFGVAPP